MFKTVLCFFIALSTLVFTKTFGQNDVFILTPEQIENEGIKLPDITQWKFKKGSDASWSDPNLDDSSWTFLDSAGISNLAVDEKGFFEGWFRFKIKFEGEFADLPSFLISRNTAAQDIFLNGKLVLNLGNTGVNGEPWESHSSRKEIPQFVPIELNKEYAVAIHIVGFVDPSSALDSGSSLLAKASFLGFTTFQFLENKVEEDSGSFGYFGVVLSVTFLLAFLFWGLSFLNPKQKHLVYIAIIATFIGIIPLAIFLPIQFEFLANYRIFPTALGFFGFIGLFTFTPILVADIFLGKIPKWLKRLAIILVLITVVFFYFEEFRVFLFNIFLAIFLTGYFIFKSRKNLKGPKWIILAGLVAVLILITSFLFGSFFGIDFFLKYREILLLFNWITFPIFLVVYVAFWLKESLVKEKQNALDLIKVTEEKQEILANQNALLETQVETRTRELNQSLENLKSTQAQLIQSEKMASLGELTAGIAHEIQNPLNFVNNFSEVSSELVDEMNEELEKGDIEEAKFIGKDLKENLSKINHHGKRADAIVKGMLEHSRANKGEKAPTDLNALADEFVRLSYHGLRAKDKEFNADFKLELDPNLPKVNVVASDIGRVILNLVNNAFYACAERLAQSEVEGSRSTVHEKANSENVTSDYIPMINVSTGQIPPEGGRGGYIEISVQDNGSGIPDSIKEKIFQPFFTTKPTGSGTGLGLSLSYDIVKAHGGEIRVESEQGKGATFIISLPY